MSNAIQTLMPILNGLNYLWAEPMQVYLQSQEAWIVVDPPAGLKEPMLTSSDHVASKRPMTQLDDNGG